MTHHSKHAIAVFSLVAILLTFGPTRATHGQATGSPAAMNEIVHAESVCRAHVELYQAELNFARWRSQQLETLRREGHASWLEVSRAGIPVQRLRARVDSSQHLLDFLRQLRRAGSQQAANPQRLDSVSLPRDVRRAAVDPSGSPWSTCWAALHSLTATTANWAVSVLLHGSGADGPKNVLLRGVGKDVADAELRVQRLSEIADRANVTAELARARLRLAIARARLRVARVMRTPATGPAESPHEETARLVTTARGGSPACDQTTAALLRRAWHDQTENLRSQGERTGAALNVAAAHARAEGVLRVAQAILDYQSIRLEAAREFQAHGYGSKRNMQQAERRVDEAQAYLEEARARKRRAGHRYEQLQRNEQRDGPPCETLAPAISKGPADVNNGSAVHYMICLKQLQAALSAEHLGWRAESRVERQLVRRLAATGKVHVGALRERKLAEARLALAEACAWACAEWEEIVRLEQRRFVVSCRWQTGRDRLSVPEEIVHRRPHSVRGFVHDSWFNVSASWHGLPVQVRRTNLSPQTPVSSRRAIRCFSWRSQISDTPWACSGTLAGRDRGWRCLPTAACVSILNESPGARPWLIRRFGQVLNVWDRPRSSADACCPVPWHRRVGGWRDHESTCRGPRRRWPFCRTSASLFAGPSRLHRTPE